MRLRTCGSCGLAEPRHYVRLRRRGLHGNALYPNGSPHFTLGRIVAIWLSWHGTYMVAPFIRMTRPILSSAISSAFCRHGTVARNQPWALPWPHGWASLAWQICLCSHATAMVDAYPDTKFSTYARPRVDLAKSTKCGTVSFSGLESYMY